MSEQWIEAAVTALGVGVILAFLGFIGFAFLMVVLSVWSQRR